MKLIGLMPCRNEDWILDYSVRVALQWVDSMVILDHASVDDTPHILACLEELYPGRIQTIQDPDPLWREMSHRQKLLAMGRVMGGTHFALIDADEMLTANLLDKIRPAVEALQGLELLSVYMVPVWGASDRMRVDGSWQDRWLSLAFKDHPSFCWQTREGYDFHHRHPMGSLFQAGSPFGRNGGVFHLQFLNQRRLRAKQALYKMVERVRWPDRESALEIDRKYDQSVSEVGLQLQAIPSAWWDYQGVNAEIQSDGRETWQEQECRKLYQQYGAEYFAGLNLYGVF